MIVKNVSIRNILSKLRRDYNFELEEADAIEWIAEALEHVGAVSTYTERVAFVEVKDYQALIPNGTVSIIQIARNTRYEADPTTACCETVFQAEEEENLSETCQNYDFVPLDCNGTPVSPYEVAYYRPFWDLERDYSVLVGTNWFQEWYEPVRLANHSFFNSLVCSIPDSDQLYSSASPEYTVADPYLRFSFREGFVAIAYLTQPLDENGYPMIPDHPSYREAVSRYVAYKIANRKFMAGEERGAQLLAKTEQDWHWYCKQAGNWAMMPKGVDQFQNLQDQRNYLLPRMYRYYGFFGRSATPENRFWNNTMTRYAV